MRTADLGVRPLAELCVNVLKRVWPENNNPYQDIYVTDHLDTRTKIHLLPVRDRHTHALSRNTKH